MVLACRRAPPDAGPWPHVAASLDLAGEDYLENHEIDGGLERRRPALERLLGQAREEAAQDPEIARGVGDLQRRLLAPIDHTFPQDAQKLAETVAARHAFARTPPARPDLEHGAQVYAIACAACHGPSADGEVHVEQDPPPANLLVSERAWRPYDMFLRITYGGLETAMPSFGDTVSAQERWDIVFWLFAQRWPPCAVKDAPVPPASELALSSDFDLSNRMPYDAIACARRTFR